MAAPARRRLLTLMLVAALVAVAACTGNPGASGSSTPSASRSSAVSPAASTGSGPVTPGTPVTSVTPATGTGPGGSGITTPPETGAPQPRPAISEADLAAAGVVIVADERSEIPAGTLAFTGIQVERMLTEQAVGGGVTGADLDSVAPMPAGSPPISYVVLAWVVKGTSDAARAARDAMGERATATRTAGLLFPTAVVTLFVADLAEMVRSAPDAPPAETAPGLRRPSVDPAANSVTAAGPCTAATQFLASTIKGVFDALHLTVPAGSGFFGSIIATLAVIWDYAVETARGVVQATVDAITAPVFGALRLAATALGAASMMMSYLNGQKLIVTVDPQFTRVAVGGEPDIPGRYTARAHPLSAQWPSALVDCIQAAGGQIPELMQPGAKAAWTLADSPDHPGLVIPASLDTLVADDHRTHLDFVTGREPAERAGGPERSDGPIVTVEVEQKLVTDFLRRAQQSLTRDLKSAIANGIPDPQVRAQVVPIVDGVLDPIVQRIGNEVNGRVGGMFTLRGHAEPIVVVFHDEPEPPKSAVTPSGKGKGDFCSGMRDMIRWAAAHQELDIAPFAAEIHRRFTLLRPLAPAGLRGAVDSGLTFYASVGDGSDPFRVARALVESGWPDATQQIMGHCKLKASDFPQLPG